MSLASGSVFGLNCKSDPFRYLEHLEQIDGFKLRMGDYRAIIDVDTETDTLLVLKIGNRKDVYEH